LCGDNIVGGDGSADTLEFKLPNRIDGYGVFNRHQDARAIRICPGLASSHSLDATSFEAHGAERGMSMRYADAEAKVVT
jgi:hypothetical protein